MIMGTKLSVDAGLRRPAVITMTKTITITMMMMVALGITRPAGAEADWPEPGASRAEQPRPMPALDDKWLPPGCFGLARCRIEILMKHHNICRLYVLKAGIPRLDMKVDVGPLCSKRNRDERYTIASITKPMISLLLGLTSSDSRFGDALDLSRPARDWMGALGYDYEGPASLEDFLLMRSGYTWSESEVDAVIKVQVDLESGEIVNDPPFRDLREQVGHDLPDRGLNETLPFNYSGLDTTLIGFLLQERLKKAGLSGRFDEAYEELIWTPLGMTHLLEWKGDFVGNQASHCCTKGHPADMARLGAWAMDLYRRGRARDEDPLARWVYGSIARARPSSGGCRTKEGHWLSYDFGYQWWVLPGEPFGFAGRGMGGQFLHILPDKDLVVMQFSAFTEAQQGGRRKSECLSFALHREIAEALREP